MVQLKDIAKVVGGKYDRAVLSVPYVILHVAGQKSST